MRRPHHTAPLASARPGFLGTAALCKRAGPALLLLGALATCRSPEPEDGGPSAGADPGPSATLEIEPEAAAETKPSAEPVPQEPEPPPGEPVTGASPAVAEPVQSGAVEAVGEALKEGDFREARDLLDAELARPHLESAEAALRAGRLEQALEDVDAALEQARAHPPALLLRGSLLVALAEPDGDEQRLAEALGAFYGADDCAPALVRASRVARRLGRTNDALELARRAEARPHDPRWDEAEALASLAWPGQPTQRTLAEAALDAWRKRGGARAPDAQPLFAEAEGALVRLLAGPQADAWAWLTLGEAYLEASRPGDALSAAQRGLDRLGGDARLYELLARSALDAGGLASVDTVFKAETARRPREGLAKWYPGIENFKGALLLGPDAELLFRRAGNYFSDCRELSDALEEGCLRYEALCRAGQGWYWLRRSDLVRAAREFRATEDVVRGGAELVVEGRLESASRGLQQVIDRCLEQGRIEEAAAHASFLYRSAPRDEARSRQAARLQREAGEQLQIDAKDLRRAAKGELDDAERLEQLRRLIDVVPQLRGTGRERDLFRDANKVKERQARAAFEGALAAARSVIELAPDDLRARCDAAALAIERLGSDLDWAEQQLLECVEQGRRRLESGVPTEAARFTLEEIWGDAHSWLGRLELEHRKDPARALPWFQKALEIGPLPRTEISDYYLPLCRPAASR